MATKRRKTKSRRRKSRKSCKYGKLKRRVKTKSGRKRRCKKKSRKKTKSRRRKRKTKRKSKKRKYRMNCKVLEKDEKCLHDEDLISLDPIEYENYQNYFKLIDDGGGGQCFSRDAYEEFPEPKRSPLTRAPIDCPNPELLTRLLGLSQEEKDGELVFAIEDSDLQLVKMSIKAGADVNTRDELISTTALMDASRYDSPEIVRILLDAGADVNARNMFGGTALMWAIGGDTEIIRILIQKGADVNARDNDRFSEGDGGNTALIMASGGGDSEVVRMLLNAGADVDAKNNNGNTALMTASREGHTQIVSILSYAGADVNAKNKFGTTALMYASVGEQIQIINFLISIGANVNAKDNQGRTALKYPIITDTPIGEEVVRILREAGATE